MGKYLQQLRYDVELQKALIDFSELEKIALKHCNLIDTLFNYYLPKKVVVGNQIWQIIVKIVADQNLDGTFKESGQSFESYVFFDFNSIIDLDALEQKKILLDLFLKGIAQCLDDNTFLLFREIYAKILNNKIVFNDFYKNKKASPNKNFYAQMKGFYSDYHENKKLYVTIFDNKNEELKSIFVGNYNFQNFDRIQWIDNKIIHVYHVNTIQSYKSKKVAEDYFILDIENETVTYHPTTKESMFDYGVQLLTETNDFEIAMFYLNEVRKLGHGKVENIFLNLEINPEERDKTILLQTPRKHKK